MLTVAEGISQAAEGEPVLGLVFHFYEGADAFYLPTGFRKGDLNQPEGDEDDPNMRQIPLGLLNVVLTWEQALPYLGYDYRLWREMVDWTAWTKSFVLRPCMEPDEIDLYIVRVCREPDCRVPMEDYYPKHDDLVG